MQPKQSVASPPVESTGVGDLALAARDLEHLARWLPVIEGRALVVGPRRDEAPVRHEGRSDHIDERNHTLRRAIEVLARLEALAASDGGERHLVVLAYCYLWMGEEERLQWGRKFGGLDARIGLVFAEHSQRMAWLLHPAHTMGTLAAARAGQVLRETAESAYGAMEQSKTTVRLDLASLRDRLAKLVEEANESLAILKRVREQNRVRQAQR